MKRSVKWLLPALGMTQLLLLHTHLLDARSAVRVAALIEIMLLLAAGTQVVAALRAYQRGQAAGLDLWRALEDGFAVLMPRRIARIAVLEPKLWYCLVHWLLRRTRPDTNSFPYYKRAIIGPVLLIACLTAPVEIGVGAVLIPWAWLRVLFLVGALYGVCWAFGFYASLRVLPHQLEAGGIRVRFGVFAEGFVPYEAIERITIERRKAPGGRDGLQLSPQKTIAYLATGGRTDVTLMLRAAQSLDGLGGATAPVQMLCLATDVPQAMAAALGVRAGVTIHATTPDRHHAILTSPPYALMSTVG